MTRHYEKKFLEDGSPNPAYKPQTNRHPRKGEVGYVPQTNRHPRKTVEDGSPNPAYKPQTNRHPRKQEAGYTPHTGGVSISKYKRGEFIAWDGEGFNKCGQDTPCSGDGRNHASGCHIYALMMNNLGDVIVDAKHGLSTRACLDRLTNTAIAHPHAIHVCYGASYDTNMILRDVPYEDLLTLYKGEEKIVFQDVYELEYRPRKSLTIRRSSLNTRERWREVKDKDGNVKTDKTGRAIRKRVYECTMELWDVIGFFQGAFIKSLDSYMVRRDRAGVPVMSDETTARYVALIQDIKAGKDKRSTFTPHELDTFIIPYCRKEVEALVELMVTLHGYLQEAGLAIARWDGAGACAAALLKKQHIKDYMSECPKPVRVAAQYAYAGGRIEPSYYGHYKGTVYHYDINSAYPSAMVELPTLKDGQWKRRKHMTASQVRELIARYPFSVFKISWSFSQDLPFYPFAYRAKTGGILFPKRGKTWVWSPEILAALDTLEECSQETAFYVHEAWYLIPASPVKPFDFLPALFKTRAQWKREGKGAEKVLKLSYNSLYGKMVQQLGYSNERASGDALPILGYEDVEKAGGRESKTRGKPPYHQLEWGGYITSSTRAKLFRAVMQAPTSIISLATDGIYSLVPLSLPCGKELGEWEYNEHCDITMVTSGVYWYSDRDEDTGNTKEHAFYRGFDAGTLTRKKVLDSWAGGKHSLTCESTRFITLGSGLTLTHGNVDPLKARERFRSWRSWKTIDRKLSLDMGDVFKRDEVLPMIQDGYVMRPKWGRLTPDKRLIATRPHDPDMLFNMDVRGVFPYPDTYIWEDGARVQVISHPYRLKWEDIVQEGEATIDGLSQFEYQLEYDNSHA